ncbi:hypothetical protein D3C72_1570980 [compost metagenome]
MPAAVTDNPGKFTTRRLPSRSPASSMPLTSASTAARGDSSHSGVSGATGQLAATPDSGSRMMPLANDEAAALGLPGRTLMVGRRSTRPSTKPRRL